MEPESLTLRVLVEMRDEMRGMREDLQRLERRQTEDATRLREDLQRLERRQTDDATRLAGSRSKAPSAKAKARSVAIEA